AQERRRRGEVTSLALDRLDHDRRHIIGPNQSAEDALAQDLQLGTAVAAAPLLPAADAREWCVVDHRQQGTESGALLDLAVRQRERAHGASMERTFERDQARPMRVVARQLDGSRV